MSRFTASSSRKSSKELWVGSLPAQITKAELKQHFSAYKSAIKAVVLPPVRDDHSSHSKRYAFVVFHDENSAVEAQSELNGTQMRGCSILLRFRRQQQSASPWKSDAKMKAKKTDQFLIEERRISFDKPRENVIWILLKAQLVDEIATQFRQISVWRDRSSASSFDVRFKGKKPVIDSAIEWAKEWEKRVVLSSAEAGWLDSSNESDIHTLQQLALEAGVVCLLQERVQISSFCLRSAEAFRAALEDFLSDRVVTETFPASRVQLIFIYKCGELRAGGVDSVKADVSEDLDAAILTGPRQAVRKHLQQMKEILRNFKQDSIVLVYPQRASIPVLKELSVLDRYYHSPHCFMFILESDEEGSRRIFLGGRSGWAVSNAKGKVQAVRRRLDRFTQAVEIPASRRDILLAEREALEEELDIGLEVRARDVLVYAISPESFESAKFDIERRDFRRFVYPDHILMKILCTSLRGELFRYAKSHDRDVWVEPNEAGDEIVIKGAPQAVAEFRQSLHHYVRRHAREWPYMRKCYSTFSRRNIAIMLPMFLKHSEFIRQEAERCSVVFRENDEALMFTAYGFKRNRDEFCKALETLASSIEAGIASE